MRHRLLSCVNSKFCIKQFRRLHSGVGKSAFLREINRAHVSGKIAVVNADGSTSTYADIWRDSTLLSKQILKKRVHLKGNMIAAFTDNSANYVISMLACWHLNCAFVPLCPSHSDAELQYILEDSGASIVVGNMNNSSILAMFETIMFVDINGIFPGSEVIPEACTSLESFASSSDPALVVYTSGTTGRPKGVVHTHSSLKHAVEDLSAAWKYCADDYILHFLPLHHLHGILNKLLAVLWVGGTVEFMPSASSKYIWDRLCNSRQWPRRNPTIFMGVPTVYAKMIEYSKHQSSDERATFRKVMSNMRLHVSGSSALPEPVMRAWHKLSGQFLLERYGMTETCMILGNMYEGERVPGYVGLPFPSLSCRLVAESGSIIYPRNRNIADDSSVELEHDISGELQVKGPTIFKEYLNQKEKTVEAFTKDGWFRTGDLADVGTNGFYRILGRISSDIIKSSGYKLSALEIERIYLTHPWVLEVAVLGVPDEILGEAVTAVVVLRDCSEIKLTVVGENKESGLDDDIWSEWLQSAATVEVEGGINQQKLVTFFDEHIRCDFLIKYLAPYKFPKRSHYVKTLPRNALAAHEMSLDDNYYHNRAATIKEFCSSAKTI